MKKNYKIKQKFDNFIKTELEDKGYIENSFKRADDSKVLVLSKKGKEKLAEHGFIREGRDTFDLEDYERVYDRVKGIIADKEGRATNVQSRVKSYFRYKMDVDKGRRALAYLEEKGIPEPGFPKDGNKFQKLNWVRENYGTYDFGKTYGLYEEMTTPLMVSEFWGSP